jgi:hypothetical protein
MKKYLSFFLSLFFVLSFNSINAQQANQKTYSDSKYQILNSSQQIQQEDQFLLPKINNNNSRAFTNLLTQDFSSTTFPPTGWTLGHTAGTMDWIRGLGPQTYSSFSNVGTTADNGYAFVNSDGLGSNGVLEDCWLKTSAINCTGKSYVWLKFAEFFRRFNPTPAPTGNVEVSNNGTTWTVVHSAHTGIAAGGATPNPKFVDVDISSIAANQATVYVRFHWTGSWDYYWFIDDVEVYSRPQYDASFSARTNANEYTTIPVSQYVNGIMPLSATAWNAGGSTINNVSMSVKVYDGNLGGVLYSATSNTLASLAANASGTLTATGYTPPAGMGFYIPEYIVQRQQTDADIHNDTIAQALWINDSLYARDDAVFTGSLDGSLGLTSQSGIFGQNYQVNVTDRLKHIGCYVTGGVVGDTTQILVYNTANNLPTTLLASSAIYKFTTAGAQWVDLPISGGAFSLSPGNYFIGIKQFSKTHNLGVAYTENNFTSLKAYAKIGVDPWDTLSVLGYNVSFVIRPYLVCGTYKPTISAAQNYLCTGDQLTLNSSPGSTYLWSPGGQSTPTKIISAGGSYTVSVTSVNGCSAVSNIKVINEYAKPVVNLGNDTTVCNGITLNAGSGFQSYSWTGGTSANQYLWAGSTGIFSVTVTNLNGCSKNDAITLTVNPNPIVNLGHDTSVCNNYNLNAGSGYSNYTWSGGTSSTQNLLVTSSGNYTVTVTNAHNCKGSDAAYITIKPNPVVQLGNDTIICGSNSLNLNAGNPGASSYTWWNGSGGQFHPVDVSYCGVGSTCTYSVTVTNNGCSGTDAIAVTFNSIPVVNLGTDQTVCANQSVALNAGGPYTSYSWSTGDVVQQIQVDSLGTGIGTKTVIVLVTNNSCKKADTINITFDPCTGISEIIQKNIICYPNPAHNELNINFPEKFDGEISIVNSVGQQVYSSKKSFSTAEIFRIELSGLSSGLYYLILKENGIKTIKLIIE